MNPETTLPAPQASAAPRRPGRSDTIDFWRGFVLCTIFVNHVPGNLFEKFTYRNWGFSDSAEAFVFISGLAMALAYGRRFAHGPRGPVVVSFGRRAVKLYATHIALTCAALAIFATGAAVFLDEGLMDVHGRDLAMDDPQAAFIGIVTLGHQLGYFNILPLYVLLVAAVPAMFWMMRFGRGAMLAASFSVYLVARMFDVNIPTWPMRGVWFLDPFAWQFLMAIGVAVGLSWRERSARPHPVLLTLSGLVLAAGLFCATDGFDLVPGLFDHARQWADLDKTMLGIGRLVHFLALAYVVSALGVAVYMRRTRLFEPLRLIGRHGLAAFAILSLLAAVGQVLTQGLGHTPLVDGAVVLGGLVILYMAVATLDSPVWLRRASEAVGVHARR